MNLLLLLAHAGATLFMLGLIWFVQIVHYPLAGAVGDATFPAYQAAHVARTGWVVGPPMLLELCAAGTLLVHRPAGVPAWMPWLGAALLLVIWASTALLQVPLHAALGDGQDPVRVTLLVRSNWIRTLAWTARSALAVGMIAMAWESR